MLSLIALDSKGRKFTNCTAVRPSYEVRGETIVTMAEDDSELKGSSKYQAVKEYVMSEENDTLLRLRQRFDEQGEIVFQDDLVQGEGTPQLSELLMRHNNFGICAQQTVTGESEGLARLKASYVVHDYVNGPSRLLQSEFAEIAVYSPLRSVMPLYRPYLSDLYSESQLGQEFQSFEGFYQDWQLSMQFGSSLKWKVTGGSNFWPN